MRTLNSKKQRALLWYASEGKCNICGNLLSDTWEADHKIPWSVTLKTNVHDMQAVCQICNRRKGINMWRLHQKDMLRICDDILSGDKVTEILASVTPGGGKSAFAAILASKLIPIFADRICWIVPRDSLRIQGERSFTSPFIYKLLGQSGSVIRSSQNHINPSRGTNGYIDTYQSVQSDPDLHRLEFDRFRYILILDEPHHVVKNGRWHKALQPLVDKAVLVVYASGTFERHDREPIAFIPYTIIDGQEVVDISETKTRKVILYSRTRALREDVVNPLHFEVLDGRAEWVNEDGEFQNANSLNEGNGADSRHALYTALTTEYAYSLLESCIVQWQKHVQNHYKKAKILIISPNIIHANKFLDFCNNFGLHFKIATSEKPEEARENIDNFRRLPNCNGLITVGMAYEGLDVPEITFIACLAIARSKPWLEQCFARANRKAKGKKYAVVWIPDDTRMGEIVKRIKDEQNAALKVIDDENEGGDGGNGNDNNGEGKRGINPIGSKATTRSALELENGTKLNIEKTRIYLEVAEELGMDGLSTVMLAAYADQVIEKLSEDKTSEDITIATGPILTQTEYEKSLKREINFGISRYCNGDVERIKSINVEIKRYFRKSRMDMTIEELKQALAYVNERYT